MLGVDYDDLYDKIDELEKRSVDNSYELHYTRQMIMKILAHIIAADLAQDKVMAFGELTFEKSRDEFLCELNCHIAKVHFTQDELNDISKILEESKKFI